MTVYTKRVHAEKKSLKIEADLDGRTSLHPYDAEVAEGVAHQIAAANAVDAAGIKAVITSHKMTEPGHFIFTFETL